MKLLYYYGDILLTYCILCYYGNGLVVYTSLKVQLLSMSSWCICQIHLLVVDVPPGAMGLGA